MTLQDLFGALTGQEASPGTEIQPSLPGEGEHLPTQSSAPKHLTTYDCMSEKHAFTARSHSQTHIGHGPEGTPTSLSPVGTTSTSQSSSRRGSKQPRPSTGGHMNAESINLNQLQLLSRDYERSPQAAKQWLRSFGNLHPGTNVSLRLVAAEAEVKAVDTDADAQYPSILPILSKWLRIWFDKASTARYQKRKNQTDKAQKIFVPEDDDFEWICTYTTDYLAVARISLMEEDIVGLVETTLYILAKSGAPVDFDRLLKLLQSLFSRFGCPQSIFENSLYVLCGIRGSFRELPAHFQECLDLVLSGQGSVAGTEILHGFLRKYVPNPEDTKASTITNAARGVLQIFHQMLGTNGGEDIPTEELLTSISSATMLHNARVNEVVLSICVALIEQNSSIPEGSDEQFSKFMDIINVGYPTARAASHGTEDSPLDPLPSSKDTKANGFARSSNARDSIDSAMENLLRTMTGLKQSLVFKHFVILAASKPLDTSIRVLQFAGKEMLNPQRHENWNEHALNIVQSIIQNRNISSDLRLVAINIVQNALWAPSPTSFNRDAGLLRVDEVSTTGLVQELFKTMKSTIEPLVLEAVVKAVVCGALTYERQDSVQQICIQLADVVTGKNSLDFAVQASEIAARGLVSIFLQSLNTKNVERTALTFRQLNQIAASFDVPAATRLAAMRLLFRIRCDWDGRVYVSRSSDSEYLAAALCRTDESAAKFFETAGGGEDQSNTRGSNFLFRRPKPTPPLWIYPGVPALPSIPPSQPSEYIFARAVQSSSSPRRQPAMELELCIWLETLIKCLQKDSDWETYSYVIVHVGAQLSNVTLFENTISRIQFLRSVLCEKVLNISFYEPPIATGLKKGDVALCLYDALTPLIAYKAHFARNECDDLVKAFKNGIGSFEGTSRGCIHSLSICCFEIPASVTKNLSEIIGKIQTSATQSHLSMHFLEFFANLARLRAVHNNLHGDKVRLIFGICIAYIKSMRDRRSHELGATGLRSELSTSRQSGGNVPPYRAKIISAIELPQYVTALAYHTIIFWFLSLRLSERTKHVPWIVKSLVYVDNDGNEQIEEQSEVLIDLMQRTACSNLGETVPHPDFNGEVDDSITAASWLIGMSVVTIETAGSTGSSQITKRQASGTTHAIYQQHAAPLPSHHAPVTTDIRPETSLPARMLPQHVFLQMTTTCAPAGLASQPLALPDVPYVRRAIREFDKNPTVDGHKIGVIYVGPGQTREIDILANTQGSRDFEIFLDGLGTKVELDEATFNTQGLRSDSDGEYTYAWRDRVSEIVYHIPCMMPTNLEDDPQCTNKKSHIGNDHVNIIFNRSGEPFDFDTFSSQFNYVNIVITPATRISAEDDTRLTDSNPTGEETSSSPARRSTNQDHPTALPQFYSVHTLTAPGFPAISPASDPKILSSSTLPGLVRLMALNASVFSLAWRDRDSPTHYVSSWRNRLQEIRRLRDRVTRDAAATVPEPRRGVPLYGGYDRRGGRAGLYPEGRGELTGERRATVVDYENVEVRGEERMSDMYDFSRWTMQ